MGAFSVFSRSLGRLCLSQQGFISLKKCGKVKRKAVDLVRCFSDSDSNILRSSYPEIEIPNVLLHDFVFQNLHQWENKVALESGESGRKVTYRDFYNTSKILARSYQKKFKLKKEDYQFVLLPNCPEYPSIFMAGSMAGLITTTSNPLYTSHEISHQMKETDPKIIFTIPEMYGNCVEALNNLKKVVPIVVLKRDPNMSLPPGAVDFVEIATSSTPEGPDPVALDVDSSVIVPFSSGTSGLPKGVELTHKNIISNLSQLKTFAMYKSNKNGENNQAVTLAILPMFHIYGMVGLTFDSLSSGERLVTLSKFEPKIFVETIYKKKATLLFLVPPLVYFLAHQPLVESKHLASVHCMVNGAAASTVADCEALKKKAPQIMICQGYGMTETSPVITLTHIDRTHKYDSVGHPVNLTQIKIADLKTGEAAPRGTMGEILVKGPQVMKGYLNQPQITKDSFDSDGWLKTGDVGYCDKDGDLFVTGRIKELIKVKGFQVAPAEIEDTLKTHPKIADVCVVGVPHPTLGEAPKAFVIVKPGAELTEEEVIEYVKKLLIPYKQLQGGVSFIKTIPRNSTGKVLRRALLELHKNSSK